MHGLPVEVDPRAADVVRAGKVRAAVFLPQYIKDAATGELRGFGTGFLTIEIARALAARLGVETMLVEQPSPPQAIECVKAGACDMLLLGIEPSRVAQVDFTPPVVQFDYTCLVPASSPIRSIADADKPGVRIAIVESHASALALKRMVKHAELVGAELPDDSFDLLRAGKADVFALPRDQLLLYSTTLPGSRVLEEPYGINRVGIAVAKHRAGWLAYVSEFAEEAKASGLIQDAIQRGSLHQFEVAPRADVQLR